jgi:hypothetical protein
MISTVVGYIYGVISTRFRLDPIPKITGHNSTAFNKALGMWGMGLCHTFEEAFCYVSSVNSASSPVRFPKPSFQIEKTAERGGRRCGLAAK